MASNSIVLKDTTYNGVSSIELPVSGGGSALFTDVSDTTAAAADVAQGKYFYTAAGAKTQGTAAGGSANIEALNITQNGTYTASGGVDGYSPVTVNVSGGGDDGSFKAVIDGTATSPTLPSDLTAIRNYAFYYLSSLSSVDIPSGVTSIGNYAFYRCSDLETASLPDALTSIGDNAFYYCSKFDISSLPNSLQTIGNYGFARCSELSISSLPANLKTIGQYAFDHCSKITITSVPSGVTKIENYSFQECGGITQMSLPNTVTSLANGAFYGCNNMGTFTASGALTTIGSQAFRNCSKLTDARFPNASISSFPSNAFMGCGKLEIVDIGNTSSIPASAFANCYKLQTLVLRKTGSICTLANVSAFTSTPMSGYNSLTGTVYVPSALISTYQTASNWKTLYDGGTLTFAAIEGSQYAL